MYEQLRNQTVAGIKTGQLSYDWQEIIAETKRVQQELEDGIKTMLSQTDTKVIQSKARIEKRLEDSCYSISTDTGKIQAKKIILATGSKPVVPKIPGIENQAVLTSDTIFSIDHVPQSLCIIGGGVIGMELASIFAGFGCKVTVIEAMKRILGGIDKEIVQNLSSILRKRGIEIHTDAKVTEIIHEYGAGQVICSFVKKDKTQFILCDQILAAVGRKPDTSDLCPEGFLLLDHGAIAVNQRFETNQNGIYAIGDVTGKANLAHTASAQAECVIAQIAGEARNKDLSVIPSCIYTSPEIACAGMTEKEAESSGRLIKTGKYMIRSNAKSILTGQERGLIKIVADLRTDEILGAQLMCARATDMIGELVTAISNHMTTAQLQQTIRAHPTYNEAVGEALYDVDGRSLYQRRIVK